MPKLSVELKPLTISRLSADGMHPVGGVSGLYLSVRGSARSWILRTMLAERRVEIGLGPYPEVGVAAARAEAAEIKKKIRAMISASRELKPFAWCVDQYLLSNEAQWKNAKHRQQWRNTLAQYALPTLGVRAVGQIERADILEVLRPIWFDKTETASRLRGRLERVLDWAKNNGLRHGDNPASYDRLRDDLPPPKKIAPTENHRALPYSGLPALFKRLHRSRGVSARCLEFLILTAVRSGDARGATWAEFDLAACTWEIPAERIKMKVSLVVPLSDLALAIVTQQRPVDGEPPADAYVFQAPRGGALSDMAMTQLLRGMSADCVVHGFRTTFRTWAAETTNHPREVCEFALAHRLKDKVEAAYNRSNLLDKRVLLMRDWAAFCGG
jgi:integrase